MALQYGEELRHAMLDQIETIVGTAPTLEIYSGSMPANCAAATTGTLLAQMTLPSDWMAAATGGAKAKSGTWEDTSANATGTAGYFRIFEGATCHIQGTVTATGGGGDLQLTTTSITAAQAVTISTFTITGGNA